MPRPPRRSRARIGDSAELKAWGCCFETGYDWGDLGEIGVTWEATKVWHDEEYPAMRHTNSLEILHDLARDAWKRLGAAYMRQRPNPPPYNRDVPWALTEFGEPGDA